MKFIDLALPLVASFEGCHDKRGNLVYPYLDRLAKPNIWTRGYGRTYGIDKDSPPISVDEAKQELAIGLDQYAKTCIQLAPSLASRPACLAAVTSWSWNCGLGAFRVSRLRRAINNDRWEDAANHIQTPITAGGREIAGLKRRRQAEYSLFLTGINGGNNG